MVLDGDTDHALVQAKDIVKSHVAELKAASSKFNAHNDAPTSGNFGSDQMKYKRQFAGLIKDFEGQITEALSRKDWFEKWGKHYLPSLKRAHELQQCNNFKDPGIQDYAGNLFSVVRDTADDAFNSLPPPVPSATNSRNSVYGNSTSRSLAPSAPISMSAFNSSSAPCFHGDMLVKMAEMNYEGNRKTKFCKDIHKGDIIQMTNDKLGEVVCVLKTIVSQPDAAGLVKLKNNNDLVVTYWHPVRVNGMWSFPCMIDGAVIFDENCDAVYSFVVRNVDGSKVTNGMIINEVECITLGHDIQDDSIASHTFFGSTSVIEDMLMNDYEGYQHGLIVLECGNCIKKDEETGLINGFKYNNKKLITSF